MAVLLKGARLIDPSLGLDQVQDLLIDEEGYIAQVGEDLDCADAQVRDLSGRILVPGLVDMHVHLRDPGYEYKEDIASGSRAAARGGFTAVLAMPNTDPVCDTGAAVAYVRDKARECACTRIYQAGALTKGLQGKALSEMGDMYAEGAIAFSDDGRGVQDAGMMRRCMDYAKQFHVPVLSHCQMEDLVGEGVVNEGVVSTRLGLAGWPAQGEELQIARDIMLCELTGCPLHIQHLTTATAIEMIRKAKEKGLPVSCEVTPHHLFLSEEDLDEDYDTSFKMNPPLRTKENCLALQEALRDGTVDVIATDHAPHAAHEKALEFELAPFGTTGLETSLPLMLTEMVHKGLLDWSQLVQLMAINPRRILGLEQVRLEPGSVADLTIIDPEEEWLVCKEDFESKSDNSAFLGWICRGRATDVYVQGKPSLLDGTVIDRVYG